MARFLQQANGDKITTTAINPADNFSIFGWYKPGSLNNASVQFLTNTSGNAPIGQGNNWNFHRSAGGQVNAVPPATPTNSVWNHVGVTYQGSTGATAYTNGVAGTLAAATNSASLTSTLIFNCTGQAGATGSLAEWGMWDAVLSPFEAYILSQGIPPYLVRPGNLVMYYSLDGISSPELDIAGRTSGTLTGTRYDAHPPQPLYWPRSLLIDSPYIPPATSWPMLPTLDALMSQIVGVVVTPGGNVVPWPLFQKMAA